MAAHFSKSGGLGAGMLDAGEIHRPIITYESHVMRNYLNNRFVKQSEGKHDELETCAGL